jgi:hypothetical protein
MIYDLIQEEIDQLERGYYLLIQLDVLKAICAISELEYREHTQEIREVMNQIGPQNPFNALKGELNLILS